MSIPREAPRRAVAHVPAANLVDIRVVRGVALRTPGGSTRRASVVVEASREAGL